MRSGYSDVNWFLRAARVVPVIAGTALLGGMIGGFAMFAIDSALTWQPASEPASQARPETRADNAASAGVLQTNKPVRIVGGAIPDPSAGMSGPPPALQQQRSPAVAGQSQISSQLLTPKPLGPASQLQPQAATAAPNSPAPQAQNQPTQNQATQNQAPQNQTANQKPVATQAVTGTPQQPTRWPDALSRANQNAAKAAGAQQQGAPAPATVPTNEHATTKNSEPDRKEANTRAASPATGDVQDRVSASRHSRQDARGYDRLYNSYGKRRDRSYGNPREQSYDAAKDDQNASYGSRRDRSYGNTRGQPYGDTRYDQDDSASRTDESRSDTRRYGRDTHYRGRSRAITREQSDESDRGPAFEARQPRSEPFWGGGFFRRDDWGD